MKKIYMCAKHKRNRCDDINCTLYQKYSKKNAVCPYYSPYKQIRRYEHPLSTIKGLITRKKYFNFLFMPYTLIILFIFTFYAVLFYREQFVNITSISEIALYMLFIPMALFLIILIFLNILNHFVGTVIFKSNKKGLYSNYTYVKWADIESVEYNMNIPVCFGRAKYSTMTLVTKDDTIIFPHVPLSSILVFRHYEPSIKIHISGSIKYFFIAIPIIMLLAALLGLILI